jgi:hypothetical protein
MSEPLYAVGFEAAIVGVGYQFNTPLVVYDRDKCIDILITKQNMSALEAYEWMDYNVQGAWMGATTPVFITVGRKTFGQDEDEMELSNA